ncbi:hypothetical protein Pelo_7007 [Pelomyxa schiedti]|nr:hypothetical protein Pelo_7007 [Pelomyxa schiedti]
MASSVSVDGGDDVVCRVCMDVYRDPVFLECDHTVCRSCALTTLVAAARLTQLPAAVACATTKPTTAVTTPPAHSRVSANGTLPGQTNAPQPRPTTASVCRWGCCSHDTPVEIRCPFRCERTTKATMSGDNLKPNSAAMSLIESRKAELVRVFLNKTKKQMNTTLCEMQYCCEEPASLPSPATCKCSLCRGMLFCEPCFTQHHQKGNSLRAHQATEIPPQGRSSPAAPMCPHHANKERDLMCSCGAPICYLCEKATSHRGHTSVPLVDSVSQKVSELRGLTKELNDISEKEVEAISKINVEQLSVPKVITEGCTPILADLQLILGAVETRCKEINEMSQSLSDAMKGYRRQRGVCVRRIGSRRGCAALVRVLALVQRLAYLIIATTIKIIDEYIE